VLARVQDDPGRAALASVGARARGRDVVQERVPVRVRADAGERVPGVVQEAAPVPAWDGAPEREQEREPDGVRV
jgi:hypothetical protein